MQPLNVALIQQSCTVDREANIEKSLAGIRSAAAHGVRLVVLQELHTSLYFC